MYGVGKNKHGETCSQAYVRNLRENHEKIDLLKKRLIEKSIDPDIVDWGHVGSAEHINELLDEVLDFVG